MNSYQRKDPAFTAILFIILTMSIVTQSYAQNYNSAADGNWASGSSWSGPGWALATPSTNGGYGTLNIYHDIVLNGNLNLGSITLNIFSGASLTVNGNLSGGGAINMNGGNLSVSGNFSRPGGGNITVGDNATLNIGGNADLSAVLQINRGGKAVIDGNVTVVSSNYLIVAETGNANPTKYADLIIKQDLISVNSGDVTINKNGRVAIYGNVSGSGGGTLFTLNEGGQTYVHGDMSFTGGGSRIENNNPGSPNGLYVNGTVANTGGGANTTTNVGDQQDLYNSNPAFAEWIASEPGSPLITTLPVTLLDFKVAIINSGKIVLSWSTSYEENNSHFVILRSTDAKTWKEIGIVEGKGSSTIVQNYKYTDPSAMHGLSYYMLKQVDFDGMSETFRPVSANNFEMIDQVKIMVFPNPTAEMLNINFLSTPFSEKREVLVFDLMGEIVKKEMVSTNALRLDISMLKKGTYILKINPEAGNFKSMKIVKI